MYDIFFIGKQNSQWDHLKKRFPTAKQVESFEAAQKKTLTKMFWTIWPDVLVANDFDFTYEADEWSLKVTHVFRNGNCFDGICLFPRRVKLSDNEIKHRIFTEKKEVDIVASVARPYDYFEIESYEDYQHALEKSTTDMFWMGSYNISPVQDVIEKYTISIHDQDLLKQTHAFIHQVGNEKKYNGLFLCSKHALLTKREVEYRFPVTRIEHDIVGSTPAKYDVFEIDSYDEYQHALENSKTELFWMISRNLKADLPDIYFSFDNEYDRKQNHAFIHRVNDKDYYNGVFLCSKHVPLSKKEVEYRFPVTRKEWDVVASGPVEYDKFVINDFKDYLAALENSKTELFWAIPNTVNVVEDFEFNMYFPFSENYDRKINHVFLNGKYHDGIVLCSKHAPILKREWEYRFITHKKEYDIVASTPKPFDIVFISYNEPNADSNYKRLQQRFPSAKRIHGVKGIHQAHIAAAKLCDTEMFWIVDGDAEVVDNFDFDHQVAQWDRDTVHVWESQNPINDLVYGYGGVKLFPTKLTVQMDVNKPDMTTSITHKFKAMEGVSNVTAFNTDEFNTWKSAFRECCKLASKVIIRQDDKETEERLLKWKTIGQDKAYGEYAIQGAIAGEAYGLEHKNDLEALAKINNFEWLEEKFKEA